MKAPAAVSGRVVRVKLLHSSETCLCVPLPSEAIDLEDGAAVIVPTRHGSEIGRVLGPVRDETELRGAELFEVIRQADAEDLDGYDATASSRTICCGPVDAVSRDSVWR